MLIDLGKLGTLSFSRNSLRPENFAPFAAPSGYHWEFVTNENLIKLLDDDGEFIVDLVRNI